MERSETLGIVPPHRDAKNANIGFLGDNIRVIQTLFMGMMVFRGVRFATPPATSTRASPSAFNLQVGHLAYQITAANNRITAMMMPITAAQPPN